LISKRSRTIPNRKDERIGQLHFATEADSESKSDVMNPAFVSYVVKQASWRATSAALNDPVGIALDASGNLFIGDTYNDRIRKVSANGTITTIAGSGAPGCPSNICFSGDGGVATSAQFHSPMGVEGGLAGLRVFAATSI
jgi:NHL repeat